MWQISELAEIVEENNIWNTAKPTAMNMRSSADRSGVNPSCMSV